MGLWYGELMLMSSCWMNEYIVELFVDLYVFICFVLLIGLVLY